MNYKKHYQTLIDRAKYRDIVGYTENHHIIPRCMGGNDSVDNIVALTPEEHFVAHQLLVKIYPTNRDLAYAVQLMTTHHTENRIHNKLFGWMRKRMAEHMSTQSKQWIAENGHPKGMLGKKHSEESNTKRRETCKRVLTELRGVSVYAYNLDGTFYKEYASLQDCASDLGSNASNVKYTAEGKFGHCKGKQLRYDKHESIAPYSKVSKLKGRVRSKEHCENISKSKMGKTPSKEWCESHSEKMKQYHAKKKQI